MTSAPPRTSRSIRDAIEDDIVTGKLPPGAKLDESSLSQRFEVSRTPIREALRFLAERGMVELIRNRGAFVVEMSVRELIEMFEVMAELEGMCGRLCARRITPELREELLSAHRACMQSAAAGRSRRLLLPQRRLPQRDLSRLSKRLSD